MNNYVFANLTRNMKGKTVTKTKSKFKAVDFFCGAGGMTIGFTKAGVSVLGGIDIDAECERTYSTNNPNSNLEASSAVSLYAFYLKLLSSDGFEARFHHLLRLKPS